MKVKTLAKMILSRIHGIPVEEIDFHEDTPVTMKLGKELVDLEDALRDAMEGVVEEKIEEKEKMERERQDY